jgi:hypothetical protein
MKVGDLVRFKHAHDAMGVVTRVDPNIHDSVTYSVWVSWNHMMSKVFTQYNFQLDVISECK